jgi:hypothetical protein
MTVGVLTGAPPAGIQRRRVSLREVLAQAPVGEYGLTEGAFAWQQLRRFGSPPPVQTPPVQASGVRAAVHLPIAYTDHEEVAARLARVLTGLTWAVVTRTAPGCAHPLSVAVPQADYHRVIRALTGAWRRARREFGAAAPTRDQSMAAALWRMALLIHGSGPVRDAVYLRTGVPFAADLLHRAAGAIGVSASVEHRRGDLGVLICRPSDVARLLAATGAGRPGPR